MEKVGIITIIDNDNYGNRLQNYALQEILKKKGFEVITFRNQRCTNEKRFFLLRVIKNRVLSKRTEKINEKRKQNFERFNENIIFSKKTLLPFYKYDDFSWFITGSDQVWNPNIGRMKDVDLLTFAPANKRISFAASFGVGELNKSEEKKLKKGLSNFKSISVREEAGKKIIEKVSKKNNVEVLVDPTMLLKKEEWDKVSTKPDQLYKLKEQKYILNYFLGELSEDRKMEIERIANENKCKIINILDKKDPFNDCGPSEFLYLEKHAFLICTDSFHSSVFAIIFNRPFVVFDREQKGMNNMSSRIDTLLSKFELKDRKYNGKNITKENIDHDYSKAYKILENERKKSEAFLRKALGIDK